MEAAISGNSKANSDSEDEASEDRIVPRVDVGTQVSPPSRDATVQFRQATREIGIWTW